MNHINSLFHICNELLIMNRNQIYFNIFFPSELNVASTKCSLATDINFRFCSRVGSLLNNEEYFRRTSEMLRLYLEVVCIYVFVFRIFCIRKVL